MERAQAVRVRRLEAGDFDRGFLETLGNLADVGLLQRDAFQSQFSRIAANPDHHIFVAVMQDRVVGSIALLVEPKFIHEAGSAAHIEDVVTRAGFEARGVGRALVEHAIEVASEAGCYKVVLDCSQHNVGFYSRLGFREHETGMRLDLPER